MKILKAALVFILIIFAVLVFLEIIPTAPGYPGTNPWIIKEGERPLIIPHGGAEQLYPQDTKYAFDHIYQDGYDVFEIDLCLTNDNQLISEHDVSIQRTAGENMLVHDYTYVELIQYNYGKNFVNLTGAKPFASVSDADAKAMGLVPANLEDLFKTYQSADIKFILELKDTEENSGNTIFKSAVSVLLGLLDKYNMYERVIVSSFDDNVTHLIQSESDGKVLTSTATKDSFIFSVMSTLRVDFFYKPKDGALLLPAKDDLSDSQRTLAEKLPGFLRNQLVTYDASNNTYYTNLIKQNIIDDAHRHNMAVQYWTVNDPDEMRKLIKMGVDGIITDRPDVLKQIEDEMFD